MDINIQRQQGTCLVDVSFHSDAEGITALFGPSGAGKSSVINMVAGLSRPDSGKIYIQGHCLFDSEKGVDLPPEKRNIGYVFQEGCLFPHLTVKANLLYGRNRKNHRSATTDFDQVVEVLGIGHLLSRKPNTLSGGEKQRVAFGRAVLSNPDILLMDEPLASLDKERKEEILPFIKKLNAQFGIPILYVSHSMEEIHELTSTVLRLDGGKLSH